MLRKEYPQAETLLQIFNPDTQIECVARGDRCFVGKAPSLLEVRTVYGEFIAETWLEIQLRDLSEFAGCKEKMSESQLEATAKTIILHFGYLKFTELMVFFQQFKAGMYGRFYGAVDGLVITEALQGFLKYRADRLRRIEIARRKEDEERRECERKIQMERGDLLTLAEWNELKWLFNLGYENNDRIE